MDEDWNVASRHGRVSAAAIVMRTSIDDPILPSSPGGRSISPTQLSSIVHCPGLGPALLLFLPGAAHPDRVSFCKAGTTHWVCANHILVEGRGRSLGQFSLLPAQVPATTPRMCSPTFAMYLLGFHFRSSHSSRSASLTPPPPPPSTCFPSPSSSSSSHPAAVPFAHFALTLTTSSPASTCSHARNLAASSTSDLTIQYSPDYSPTAPLETFNSGGITRTHREPADAQQFLPCFGRPTACAIASKSTFPLTPMVIPLLSASIKPIISSSIPTY